jgi:hypothetical protein
MAVRKSQTPEAWNRYLQRLRSECGVSRYLAHHISQRSPTCQCGKFSWKELIARIRGQKVQG